MARPFPQFRLYLLGTFRIECNSAALCLPTRKHESLLAYLALHPEAQPREKLAALLWGDSTDEQARHSLRTALAAIRKELGGDVLIADREMVQLNPDFPIWVDAREISDFKSQISDSEIEDQKSKIENYAGDLLPDFYDDWILPERERLRTLYLDALLQLTQHHRARSEYTTAIEYAQKVLATDPANEKVYLHIIFCLAATGNRIGALKQYDECVKKLRDELGVEPSKETIALRDQIEAALTGSQAREALFTNVPAPLTSFIGREKELAKLRELVARTRLLTLTGAGGAGKTRLAIQLATELANANCFKNGVWWVELAALSNSALVPQTVAAVFDLRESADTPILAVLRNYLRAKQVLLVLDNCEHLIVACAQLVEGLLSVCPQLRILATSREVLNITGEVMWRVPSLGLPEATDLPAARLLQCDAVRLFVQRAQAVAPNWRPDGNLESVAQICARLDGIPLAIELAAMRVKTLSVEQIAARLDDRFRLLTSGSRTELPRHQTLRATMDWSCDLLPDAERATFRQLSVFAGGWTLEAAEAVVGQDSILSYNILDYLTALVDKSLVVVEQKENATRHRLLETIRQYARDRLLESGEADLVRDRHLDFYLAFAKQAEPELHGAEQFQWLDRLDLEHDNIRTALECSLSNERADKGFELVWALLPFWEFRGYWSEGKEWASRLLAHVSTNKLARVKGLLVAGVLCMNLGDWEESQQYLEELVVIARELGEAGKLPLALGLGYLGSIVFSDNAQMGESMLEEGLAIARAIDVRWVTARVLEYQADLFWGKRDEAAARRAVEESLAIRQSMDDRRNAAFMMGRIGRALFRQHDCAAARHYVESSLLFAREIQDRRSIMRNLIVLGEINSYEGKDDFAKQCNTEGLEMARELGAMRTVTLFSHNLAEIALREGEYDQAKSLFVENLGLARELNFEPLIVGSLMGLGGLLAVEKKALPATKIMAFFQKFIESGDIRTLGPVGDATNRRRVALARAQLDDATFNAAWAEGQKMTLEQALEYALEQVK